MFRPLHAVFCAAFSLLTFLSGAGLAEGQEASWPASYGGDDPPATLDPEERRALDVMRAAMAEAGASPCRSSERLTLAARAHARQLLGARTSRRIAPRTVRAEVLRTGAIDPVVLPWALAYTGELDLEAHRERLIRRYGRRPPTHCGVGVAVDEGRRVVALIGVRRRIQLDSFPVRLSRGDRVRVHGRLEAEFRAPSVLVTTPLGDVIEHQTLRRSGSFGAWLDFTTTGRYTVEVMADGAQGPQIVALFPVFVDVEPEDTEEGQRSSPSTAATAPTNADELLAALNRERQQAQLEPLQADRALRDVALAHSRDMVRQGYFGHVAPDGDDLTERLSAAGLSTLRAAENLVRATSFANAHAQLMESPSHRANLLDPEVTHVGIGVVERSNELIITQIFVDW